MSKRKFFRTSFRGFNRKDVLAHIEQLHDEQQQELERMQLVVVKARQKSEEVLAEARAIAQLPAEQLAELEQLREWVAQYEQQTAQLQQQQEVDREQIDALKFENEALSTQLQEAQTLLGGVRALLENNV